MELSSTRIGEPTRRDHLLLVSAFAVALLIRHGRRGRREPGHGPVAEMQHQ